MKSRMKIGVWATAIMFAGTLGTFTAQAAPPTKAAKNGAVEVTGCLESGPAAKEYLVRTNDGTTWGVMETDMMMNNYVDHEVTVAGDIIHPTASERSTGAQHFLRAYDLVVESGNCHK